MDPRLIDVKDTLITRDIDGVTGWDEVSGMRFAHNWNETGSCSTIVLTSSQDGATDQTRNVPCSGVHVRHPTRAEPQHAKS